MNYEEKYVAGSLYIVHFFRYINVGDMPTPLLFG